MQSVLMRRKTELEQMLHNARGTSFENPDTSRVSIGTIVTLREVHDKRKKLTRFSARGTAIPTDTLSLTKPPLDRRYSVMKSVRPSL